MAKKATTTEAPAKAISKTEAVRQALADDPTLSGTTGAEYLKAKFNLSITPAMFSNYKSVANRKNGTTSGKSKGKPVYHSPTLDDLKKAKELVASLGVDSKKVLEIVATVQSFGDATILADSLKFWQEQGV